MTKLLGDLEPVYVVGAGWHRYQRLSQVGYVDLGLTAVRGALDDAGLAWGDVDESFIGTGHLGMAVGRPMLKHLGALGKPLVHVENASASGSAAFRLGCVHVAAGISDVALVLGVDKPRSIYRAPTGTHGLADDAIVPFTHFSLLSGAYTAASGVTDEDLAQIAVKNHRNGSLNPNAHRQQERTLEEVLGGRRTAGSLTSLQCCPVGEGAAAVIVASAGAIARLGIDPAKAIRVASSATVTETTTSSDQEVTREVIARALHEAQTPPSEVDVFELHDAFTIEEAQYVEASGIAPPGKYVPMLKEGAFDIGGQCAVSTSGGLLAMGHPIGPTGVGQIGEIALQLRGSAGPRQHPGARVGLAHMVGLGAVGYAHVLRKD
ncbi:thiolase family protein [Actinomadura sp. LD22]|uniref:Thiolase family protein n=1 Tax=Actinomadura physcomitrii TaxID=2650748 RepID=A0A6I4MG91_9ACTN|nr:thiolase family protein [Actinomadura physcomitrii]MWA01599.1 thiolase family protein [Actinomadura physcomitrii]